MAVKSGDLRTLILFRRYLWGLAVAILGLMALGAGVRTMNAGLSCPDWPLCFGKVIPDFHVGVWFEFVHRAYAGLVALFYAGALIYAWRSKVVPVEAKRAAGWGALALTAQIVMGGLTVLLLVKAVVVTMHLLLATLFFAAVWSMNLAVGREIEHQLNHQAKDRTETPNRNRDGIPSWFVAILRGLPFLTFLQIAIGGLVASTYAGSVCVDWPLCNGQWVPTWKGAIGLQIIHRFVAYGLALVFTSIAVVAWMNRAEWNRRIVRLSLMNGGLVLVQVAIGVLNLLYYIPPHITVPHQTVALLLFAGTLAVSFHASCLPVVIKTAMRLKNSTATRY